MNEVAIRIKMKDSESAKKWLLDNQVAIFKFSKKDVVYYADLEYTVSRPYVQDLQQRFPMHWQIILKDFLDNEGLFNYFLLNLGESRNDKAFTIVKLMNKNEEELYKSLTT